MWIQRYKKVERIGDFTGLTNIKVQNMLGISGLAAGICKVYTDSVIQNENYRTSSCGCKTMLCDICII